MKPNFRMMKTFVPAKDFELSRQFYGELFESVWQDDKLCEFKLGDSQFFLQNFYAAEFAQNSMYQIMCSNAQQAWEFLSEVVKRYEGASVRPPKEEPWGVVVHLIGPSGELWHVTEPHS